MRFFLLLCVMLAGTSVVKATLAQFEVGVQTLRIPVVTAGQFGGAGEMTEWTILGKFYPQGARPVIRAQDVVGEPGQSPFTLLGDLLCIAPSADETAVRALYTPESQAIIAAEFLANPELRQQQAKWLESLQSFTILGGWAEAPDRYVLYTRVNDATTGVMPFLFQHRDNRWYLQAGSLNAPLSVKLDAVYFSPVESRIKIIDPAAAEAKRTLLAGEGLADFAARLGVVSAVQSKSAPAQ